MKHFFLFLLLAVFAFQINAQDRKSVTMPYKDGTLTFQYYEKNGVKVPDGPMEFTKGKYNEKGAMKDGYREGNWVIRKEDNVITTIECNYNKGMLEGLTTIKHNAKDKSSLKYCEPDAAYNFHGGRLLGENKIVHLNDTIYCNFGENGKRIGTWKFVEPEKTMVIEYNQDPNLQIAYEVDVLGQKKPKEIEWVEMKIYMDLLFFNDKFRQIPNELRDKKRPELPTLCENKYGYLDAWVKTEEN